MKTSVWPGPSTKPVLVQVQDRAKKKPFPVSLPFDQAQIFFVKIRIENPKEIQKPLRICTSGIKFKVIKNI